MVFEQFDWDYNEYLGPNEFLEVCVGFETGELTPPEPTPEPEPTPNPEPTVDEICTEKFAEKADDSEGVSY